MSTMTLDRWFALLIFIVGCVFSWLLARHYYRRSDKKRVPTFVVQSTATLSESVLPSIAGVKLTYDGEDIGKNGIADAKIYFWNSGTLPILKDDILEPYVISLPVRILAHSVSKTSREVVGFSVSHEKSSNALKLQFTVLEPGDGATLVLAFDGPRNTEIKFTGACLDAPKPTVLPADPIYFRPKGLRRFGDTYGSLLLVLAAPLAAGAAGGLLLGVGWLVRRLFGEQVLSVLQATLAIIVALVFLAAVLFGVWGHFKRMTAPYLPPDVKG